MENVCFVFTSPTLPFFTHPSGSARFSWFWSRSYLAMQGSCPMMILINGKYAAKLSADSLIYFLVINRAVFFALGWILVSGPPGIREKVTGRTWLSHDLAPAKGLVELRECGSYSSFLTISHSTCNYLFTWLSQGPRLTDKLSQSLTQGRVPPASPSTGDCLLPIGAEHLEFTAHFRTARRVRSGLWCWGLRPRGMAVIGGPKPPCLSWPEFLWNAVCYTKMSPFIN